MGQICNARSQKQKKTHTRDVQGQPHVYINYSPLSKKRDDTVQSINQKKDDRFPVPTTNKGAIAQTNPLMEFPPPLPPPPEGPPRIFISTS